MRGAVSGFQLNEQLLGSHRAAEDGGEPIHMCRSARFSPLWWLSCPMAFKIHLLLIVNYF